MYIPQNVLNELSEKGLTLFIEDLNGRIKRLKGLRKTQQEIVEISMKEYKEFRHLNCNNESRRTYDLELSIFKELVEEENELKELRDKLKEILSKKGETK